MSEIIYFLYCLIFLDRTCFCDFNQSKISRKKKYESAFDQNFVRNGQFHPLLRMIKDRRAAVFWRFFHSIYSAVFTIFCAVSPIIHKIKNISALKFKTI